MHIALNSTNVADQLQLLAFALLLGSIFFGIPAVLKDKRLRKIVVIGAVVGSIFSLLIV